MTNSTGAATSAENSQRDLLKNSRRWVIKIGSSLLTNDGRGLDRVAIAEWVRQIAGLMKRGHEVVMVSSGAVAEGLVRLGWNERPDSIHELQAAAAVGQMGLIQAYEESFQKYNIHTAQVLLDHDDFSNRQRYLNARSTLKTLMSHQVVPVVNENDTVVTDEIRFGDNDTLGALVANLIEADALVILTDQLGMYDTDPRKNSLAKVVSEELAGNPKLEEMASGSGKHGRGGMTTKVKAAKLAARSGANTIIAGGRIDQVVEKIAAAETVGTLLYAGTEPLAARKQWLAGHLQSRGELIVDDGAVNVLKRSGKSLLPVGVTAVKGVFTKGELVVIKSPTGSEIARGLVNYSSEEAAKIAGQPSQKIELLLGYKDYDELVHRDNLVLV